MSTATATRTKWVLSNGIAGPTYTTRDHAGKVVISRHGRGSRVTYRPVYYPNTVEAFVELDSARTFIQAQRIAEDYLSSLKRD